MTSGISAEVANGPGEYPRRAHLQATTEGAEILAVGRRVSGSAPQSAASAVGPLDGRRVRTASRVRGAREPERPGWGGVTLRSNLGEQVKAARRAGGLSFSPR